MMSTKRMCLSPSRFQTDYEFSRYLENILTYELAENKLFLLTKHNETLTFIGQKKKPTYDSTTGKRQFIELFSRPEGITWKKKYYDEEGISEHKEAPLQDNFLGIQDFTPIVNHHYVVRVNEFIEPETNKIIWVKDMVIQSGVLQ